MAKRYVRDIVDAKARTGIPDAPGLGRVVNEMAHGEAKATERYGGSTRTFPAPPERSKPQDCGDSWGTNEQGPRSLLSPDDWRRGGGQGGESRPGYVGGYRAPHGEPGQRSGPKVRPGHYDEG